MKQIYPQIYYNIRKSILFSLLLISLNACSQMHETSIAADTTPVLISSQFSFTEGPAADKEGNIYFTDQPNNKIWKYDTDGKLSVFLDSAGRSNGMYFDSEGNLISCADENDQLWSIIPDGKVTVLLNDFNGHRFNGPNDVWIDKNDGIYFSDPYYQRDYWERKNPDPGINGQKLYYLPKGKKKAIIVDEGFNKPNGLVGDHKGNLFVSDIGAGEIFKFRINNDGTLSDKKLFVKDVSDGMTLDNQGNVYLSGDGVIVYNSQGKKIAHFKIPEKWTANVCFGGKEKNILFITASKSVYTMQMNVKGVE